MPCKAVPGERLVAGRLMALVVLVAEELGKLDGGSRAIAENDVGRVDVGVRWMSRGRRDFRRRACRLGRRSQFRRLIRSSCQGGWRAEFHGRPNRDG